MTYFDPHSELPLFVPPADVDALDARAGELGVTLGGGDYETMQERCPRCGAEPRDFCTSYRKAVAPHPARAQVSQLRYARAWVPKAGEPVRLGDEGYAPHARFVEWTDRGKARIEVGGQRMNLDALALYPAGGAS